MAGGRHSNWIGRSNDEKKDKNARQKNYVFTGLEFPIVIAEVELRYHGDNVYPVINTRRLESLYIFSWFKPQPAPAACSDPSLWLRMTPKETQIEDRPLVLSS